MDTSVEMTSLPRNKDNGSITDSLKSSASKGTSSTIGALVNGVSGGGANGANVTNPSLGTTHRVLLRGRGSNVGGNGANETNPWISRTHFVADGQGQGQQCGWE